MPPTSNATSTVFWLAQPLYRVQRGDLALAYQEHCGGPVPAPRDAGARRASFFLRLVGGNARGRLLLAGEFSFNPF